jgi:Tol biopolymer transport system component
VNGGAARRLSNDPPGIYSNQPVFASGGRAVIHQSNRQGATNLWMQPLDGGRLVQLTTGPGPDESPSVARDGRIAFANARFRCMLLVHELATGKTRELLEHSFYIWAPTFSPDGRDVAFSRAEMDGSWHIWIAPLSGGTAQRLTSGSVPEIYPRFTADGASVIYHTWSPGAGRIWRVPRTGGPAVALTPLRDEDDQYGDISPDGRLLAFARTEKGKTRVYVAPVEGGESRRTIDSDSTLPRWSPDGRWIAFSQSRGFNGGVFVAQADGTNIRRVSETGSWPVWWPDGKQLGFLTTAPAGAQQISTVLPEGGAAKPIRGIQFSGSNNPFDVSPNGRLLATSNSVDLSSQIWMLDPQR